MKKFYYSLMYEVCDAILFVKPGDRQHWMRWWEASEYYRRKRDNA